MIIRFQSISESQTLVTRQNWSYLYGFESQFPTHIRIHGESDVPAMIMGNCMYTV